MHIQSNGMVHAWRLLAVALLVIGMRQPAFGQSPAVEVFVGFSHLPADGDDYPREASQGVQASVAGNFNRWFGVVADFGAQFGSSSDLGPRAPGIVAHTKVYQYLAGPCFTARTEKFDVFVQALAGGATGRSGIVGFSDSGLTFGGGGGVAFRLGDRGAIRAQLDLLGSFVDILEDNVRLGVGVAMRFGGS